MRCYPVSCWDRVIFFGYVVFHKHYFHLIIFFFFCNKDPTIHPVKISVCSKHSFSPPPHSFSHSSPFLIFSPPSLPLLPPSLPLPSPSLPPSLPHSLPPSPSEPIKHYYLRLNTQEGLILWSRSREQSFKNPSKALVLDVHRGPSNTVKSLPSFSPHDLHIYTFWVATSGGVLDLLAYNQDSYEIWITELERLASDNAAKGGPAMVAGGFKGNSVHSSRPSSSMSAVSRASIAPSVGRAFGSDTGMSRHEVMSSRSSIFTVSGEPQGINAESVNQGADSRKDPVSSKRRPFSGKQSRVTPSSSKDLEKSSSVRTAPPLESFIGEGFKSQPSVDEDVDDVII